jgi:transcriptional regulator with XRE-family HTH domain
LTGWHHAAPADSDGDSALDALADVGLVRRLLDQAELVAVRTARRHGMSWAEIATRLGVTRQSAWERWRDLDEDPAPLTAATEAAADDLVAEARERRRAADVRVPNVVGSSVEDAHRTLAAVGLVAVGAEPDGPPLMELTGTVTDQSPESGACVAAGAAVTLWIRRRGGGAGVREPRRPTPRTGTGREMHYDPVDDAVGS